MNGEILTKPTEKTSAAPPGEFIEHVIRVRYAETDQMGVVYYANYLVWFEVARTELCKRCGFRYADMERTTDSFLVVTEATCSYRSPARYDDQIRLRCRVSSIRSRAVVFTYEILNDDTGNLLAEGETKHVVMDSRGRLKKFPPEYHRLLGGNDTSSSTTRSASA
jgi:acyl-CoA thioester hydrolase